MTPVILSGGSGSRLWPLSRGMYPKQLLPLIDPDLSMLQQTVKRTHGVAQMKSPIVVCNEEHRFMLGEQLQQIDVADAIILLEPEGRNTAPAIAIAAIQAQYASQDDVVVVMPADHVVQDVAAFQQAIVKAGELAQQGHMVTFGIVPQSPETGYGYIRAGAALSGGAYDVAEFKEKPSLEVAEQFLSSGDYYWNGGIFVFKASTYLSELKNYAPAIHKAAHAAMATAQSDLDFIRVDAQAFAQSPSESIDYAVMEQTSHAKVMPLDVGWSDVGSWSALWDVLDKDADGNVIQGDVLTLDTLNSHIVSETKLVTTVGVQDLVIVETDDAVLVAPKNRAQDVKSIVLQLKEQDRTKLEHHRKVFRPWGWYDSIDVGENFQVKRIQVNAGAKLSVQMHNHRAEHWVVVKGTAEVLNGERTFRLNQNESTYIPLGVTHALRNPSETDYLEIIEVQTGSYLGEDDIVRFEDDYGRT